MPIRPHTPTLQEIDCPIAVCAPERPQRLVVSQTGDLEHFQFPAIELLFKRSPQRIRGADLGGILTAHAAIVQPPPQHHRPTPV